MNRTVELDLKYCPQCGDEYRADITVCATCAVSLLTGKAVLESRQQEEQKKANRRRPLSPDDELISIRKGPVLQMQMLQTALKQEGIPSLATSEDSGCGQGCGGPSLVIQVRASDLEDVQAVLVQDYVRTTGLHEHDISIAGTVFDTAAESAVCPACGCCFSTSQTACPECGLCFA
ncbi:hypothetical protein VU05_01770 [Desulfobulbus sp. F1]|nr:hypothetical protein [Desulfobulbus sp. F1]